MKKFLPFLFLLIFLPQVSQACVNLLYTPDSLPYKQVEFGPLLSYKTYQEPDLLDRKRELEEFISQATHDSTAVIEPYPPVSEEVLFNARNDLAVIYLLLRSPQTALEILAALEIERPGEYSVAANMGTAYELLGLTDSALIWLQKAVNINPAAHDGSEWIHVMILRYKQAVEKNSSYVASSAMSIEFGNKDLPENAYHMDVQSMLDQLSWQLNERLGFVPPPDQVVGMLLFDLGNLLVLSDKLPEAAYYYQAARDYGYNSDLLLARQARVNDLLEDGKSSIAGEEGEIVEEGKKLNVYLIAGVIALLAVIGVWILLRRDKK